MSYQLDDFRSGIFFGAFERAPYGALLLYVSGEHGNLILQANERARIYLGINEDQVPGYRLADTGLTYTDEDGSDVRADLAERLDELRGDPFENEATVPQADGTERLLRVLITALGRSDLGEIAGHTVNVMMHLEDITARRQAELELKYRAGHDGLTGLVNRRRFTELLIQHMAKGRRYGAEGAMLMIDIDNFSQINADHGHQAGDRTLKHIAGGLRTYLRGSDPIARMGGDEFAILLPSGGVDEAEQVAEKLIGTFRNAGKLAAYREEKTGQSQLPHPLKLSIGIVPLDGSLPDPDSIYGAVQNALDAAKVAGGDGIAIHRGRG